MPPPLAIPFSSFPLKISVAGQCHAGHTIGIADDTMESQQGIHQRCPRSLNLLYRPIMKDEAATHEQELCIPLHTASNPIKLLYA